MKLISHRGNINGKIEKFENNPNYIDTAIEQGYDVEIDLRLERENSDWHKICNDAVIKYNNKDN